MQNDFDQLGKLLPASWHTLIGRSLVTLDAYLASNSDGIFFQRSFVEGVAQQKKSESDRVAKVFGSALIASLITLFFDKVVAADITILSVPSKLLSGLEPLVHLAGAFANYALVLAALDLLLVSMCIGLYHSGFFLMNVNASSLWTDIFTPRYFGPKTGKLGKSVSYVIFVAVIIITVAMLFFPMAINIYYSYSGLGADANNWLLRLADISAIVISSLSILVFVLATMVPFPYRESFLKEGPPRDDVFDQERAEAALKLKEVLDRR
jgi:hypothetical protein